jgi:hypothetical protein
MWAVTYVQLSVSAFMGSVIALVKLSGFAVDAACFSTAVVAASYLVGVFSSLVIYVRPSNPSLKPYWAPYNMCHLVIKLFC